MANIDTGNVVLGIVFGQPLPADAHDYVTIDSRTGGHTVVDGNGTIVRLQIRQPKGGAQGVYASVQNPTDDFTAPKWQLLQTPSKPYSIDVPAIFVVNGVPAVTFLVEINNGDGTQSKHGCVLTGFTPALPGTSSGGGNGSGGGVSIADVQAWLVRQMGLTG